VFGVIAVVWCVMWFVFVRDSPDKDSWISDNEKNYIIESLKVQREQKSVESVPWKSIFTSVPIMAIAVANFVYNWGFFTLSSLLPSYMNDILNFDLTNSGFLSAVPFFVQTLFAFIVSPIADYLLIKQVLTVTQVRKYFNNIGFICQMIFLLLAAYLPNTITIIVCISLSVGFGAFVASGYLSNTIDVAPQYASIITGATNTFGTIAGLISPPLSGFIITTPVRNLI
jgi:MFS transporter, ACS family, solute carrier family 17 (sodium-dependent inorganic phosphate cotransporter), other